VSNSLAIATVTAGLEQMLTPIIQKAVTNAKIAFGRPDSSDNQTPLVNVYLYQVTPNGAYRNADLPARRSDGTLVTRPQAALDLHYLFTFHGDDTKLEPQRLLGAVATKLHAQPILSQQNISSALTQHSDFLAASDLASQPENVRFTPTMLNLEEFSKLWSAFFQVEYSLSAVYQASVVLLNSDEETPRTAPPAQARNLYVMPLRAPSIDRVVSQAGVDQPVVAGSALQIDGSQLSGDQVFILLDGQELAPSSVTDTQILLPPLPVGIRAGLKGLQVIQKIAMGTPSAAHRGFESNVAPFLMRPTITSATAVAAPGTQGGTNVTLQLSPNIGAGQRAILLLNNMPAAPLASFSSPPVVAAADAVSVTINIGNGVIGTGVLAPVPPGTYLARVQIDGAESPLTFAGGAFTGPTVVVGP
jgi:Pvc16 N-terminal domain